MTDDLLQYQRAMEMLDLVARDIREQPCWCRCCTPTHPRAEARGRRGGNSLRPFPPVEPGHARI
jgi:hypothetical protein